MTAQEMEQIASCRPNEWPGGEALHAGLAVILANVAADHVRSGELERASLCVFEAERCLTVLRDRNPLA